MITGFLCTNLFSKNPRDLIAFYHEKLGVPILGTLNDDADGVILGLQKDAPAIHIWDANRWGSPVQGNASFVFKTCNLDETCGELRAKGVTFDPPVRFDYGVYELRLRDPDGNEAVVVEFLK